MANLTETSTFDAGVYQLETTDPLLGGAGGVLNQATQNLANRTRYLKNLADGLVAQTPIFAAVSMTNEQDVSIVSGARDKITFDTVDTDADSLWSAANHRFIAPADGIFQVAANLAGGDVTSPELTDELHPNIFIYLNGSIHRSGNSGVTSQVGLGATCNISCFVPVSTSDYIELFCGIEGTTDPGTWRVGGTDPGTLRNESCYFQVMFIPAAA